MPELPEVETVRRGLENTILNRTIDDIILYRHDLRIAVPEDFADRFIGATITSIDRRSKYLLIYTNRDDVWISHLGMSGRMVVTDTACDRQKHDHLVAQLSEGYYLTFNDPRRFGLITYCPKQQLNTHKLLVKLGVEPLTNAFTGDYLYQRLSRKTTPIKTSIMDSHLVVGVGNIYASESLFRAGIRPDRKSNELSLEESTQLCHHIKCVLNDAIAAGGSTLKDFVESSGQSGYFQHRFQVYGRENQPCFHCQNPIHKLVQTGRSTFYCSHCQT